MKSWRRMKAQLAYKREKKKKKESVAVPEFSGFCLISIALLGLFCTLWPRHSGVAGAYTARAMIRGLGQASYLLWFLLGYRGVRLLVNREDRRPWRYLLVDGLLVTSFTAFITSFGILLLDLNPGGILGKTLFGLLSDMFGRWGGFFISGFAVGALVMWRSGRRPRDVIAWLTTHLSHDWNEWREARAKEKVRAAAEIPKKKPLPKVLPAPAARSGGDVAVLEKPLVRKPESTPFVKPTPPVVSIPAFALPARAASQKAAASAAPVPAPESAGTPDLPEIPYTLPGLELLTVPDRKPQTIKEEDLLASAQHLEKTLADFGVQGKVVEIHPGPIITRFDFTPAPGIKVQTVASLSNDIAMAMKALSVRILAPIPGKNAVGIELPNPNRQVVRLREIFESNEFQNHRSKIAIGLGKDAEGIPIIGDLSTMPHLLIAGSTGSGKSVCIHALIMSILFRATPQEVKLLLIDPKRLELPLYNGIPYLFDPNQNPDDVRVITDPKEAAKALEGMAKVMDHRFKKFASVMARDITHYNEKMASEGRPPEPHIVVIIDELADLMAVSAKEVEGSIQRITQMARAVGIHMVLATQRPSVDVITGVIKANLPSRIAFRVASQTDSRVILDSMGAESLLGQGDMLYLPPGAAKPIRLQCGLVSNREVQEISDYARAQGKPSYERIMTPTSSASAGASSQGDREELDDLQQALMLVLERKRVSQDLLKAHFGSSAKATDLLSILEVKGFIEKPEGTNRWTIYFDRINGYLSQIHSSSQQQDPVES
jgi:DNA segregation ATPase FtsK/SpoIIIE, S-DNA-T family